MTVTRNIVKTCCGNSGAIILYTDKPILKNSVDLFRNSGYTVPEHYVNSGIFYARKDTLVATASFGITKVNVKCGAANREAKLQEFEALLEQAINI